MSDPDGKPKIVLSTFDSGHVFNTSPEEIRRMDEESMWEYDLKKCGLWMPELEQAAKEGRETHSAEPETD